MSGKRPIKVFWWQPGQSGKINLGDEITKAIVERAFERTVERASLSDCDMIAVGSILAIAVRKDVFATRSEPIHVWGSGLIGPREITARRANYTYHAVRGPLTRCMIEAPSNLPLGDPGLLADLVWPAAREKRYAWGVIPHHSQLKHPEIQRVLESTERAVLIDFTDPDIARTMEQLSACDYIASSSLHGLILADVYRIPSRWIDVGAEIDGGKSWKFFDYFSSIGRTKFAPFPTSDMSNLGKLAFDAGDVAHFDQIANRQDQLIQARPSL